MQRLGESWDPVEVIRSLMTEVDSLQKIVAGQEARLQVLEGKQVIEVGDLVAAERFGDAEGVQGAEVAEAPAKPVRAGKKQG